MMVSLNTTIQQGQARSATDVEYDGVVEYHDSTGTRSATNVEYDGVVEYHDSTGTR